MSIPTAPRLCVLALAFLAGCGSVHPGHPDFWQSRPGINWQGDSQRCHQYADNLTPDDWAEIKRLYFEARNAELHTIHSKLVIYLHPPSGPTPEEFVREGKFSTCMSERGWQPNP